MGLSGFMNLVVWGLEREGRGLAVDYGLEKL